MKTDQNMSLDLTEKIDWSMTPKTTNMTVGENQR